MASTVGPSDTDSESAVRDYLTFLTDPDSLVAPELIERLEADVAKAKDPVDKLLAIASLDRAKTADPAVYERAFVQHAKAWAAKENVPTAAFAQLGVPDDVLRAAGMLAGRGRGRGRSRSAAEVRSTDGRARRVAIKSDVLESGILGLDEPFSVKDVSQRVGGSTVTVKAAIDRLEAQGRIIPAGERSGSRGRASKIWTVAVEPL
jgi:hypothetical protein